MTESSGPRRLAPWIVALTVTGLSACGGGGGGSDDDGGGSSGGGGTTAPDPDFASVRGLSAEGVIEDDPNTPIYQTPDDDTIIEITITLDPPTGAVCQGDDPTKLTKRTTAAVPWRISTGATIRRTWAIPRAATVSTPS